jgi:hypothetical protein
MNRRFNRIFCLAAQAWLVLLCPVMRGQGLSFHVSGMAINAQTSAPLAQVRILLADTHESKRVFSALTGEDGRFDFTAVPAGKFSLSGAKRGFVHTGYDQHRQFNTAIVTGPGLMSENLLLRLSPVAAVSGTIYDESGEPVRDAEVLLFSKIASGPGNRQKRTRTDDEGYYEFPAVEPGSYFLSALAQPWYAVHPPSRDSSGQKLKNNVNPALDVAYISTFYDSTTERAEATPVILKSSEHRQIDIHLNPVPALHVLFRASAASDADPYMPILRPQQLEGLSFVTGMGFQGAGPGLTEAVGVPPGKYIVRRIHHSSGGTGSSVIKEMEVDLQNDGQEITLSSSSTPFTVKVSMKFASGKSLPALLYVTLISSDRQAAREKTDQNGVATLTVSDSGKCSAFVNSGAQAFSILHAFVGKQEVSPEAIPLDPSSGEITLVLADSTTTIRGFVKRGGQAVAGAMVMLVSSNARSDFLRRDQTDSDGSFALHDVMAGTYKVMALENAWAEPWPQADDVRGRSRQVQTITVKENSDASIELSAPVEVQPR